MKKSINVKQERRGRPATGQTPLIGFRASDLLRASIIKWAENQSDTPKLSEALRRLVELGLTVKQPSRKPNESQKARASEMAGAAIDNLTDKDATPDDRVARKRRLLKGPSEFRDARVDRPKKRPSK